MEPNPDTLQFIRRLTEDGVLTDDEIWSLGSFLNDHTDARESWPGNAIYEVLCSVFADGKLDPHEIEALTLILNGIELQCAGASEANFKQLEDAAPPPEIPIDVHDFFLPQVDRVMEIQPGSQFEDLCKVNLKEHKCSCTEWMYKRRVLAEKSPGRACKHLVKGFRIAELEEKKLQEEWHPKFVGLISLHCDQDKGFDAIPTWKLIKSGDEEFIVSWGEKEWCQVYSRNLEGMLDRYAFSLNDKRWAYGAKPLNSDIVDKYFEKNL